MRRSMLTLPKPPLTHSQAYLKSVVKRLPRRSKRKMQLQRLMKNHLRLRLQSKSSQKLVRSNSRRQLKNLVNKQTKKSLRKSRKLRLRNRRLPRKRQDGMRK